MKIFNETKERYAIKDLEINDLSRRKYCVFDLEATGLDYNNEYITQIGAVIVENGKIDYANVFNMLVKSPKPIPPEIERLTSITNSRISEAPPFAEAFNSFKEFAGDAVLVSQCGFEFDFHLLKKECERNHLDCLSNSILDTKVLYAAIHRDREDTYSTDFLLKNYQIYSKDVPRHDALGDSILIGRMLIEILGEYEARGIDSLVINEELVIKKFIPKPLV